MTPEMIKKLNELKMKNTPKPPLTYKEYYNKRFLEECKYFIENPKFSIKYMMVMSHLQKNIRTKTLKEYKAKYPGAPIDEEKPSINIEPVGGDDNESVISDYDIVDNIDSLDNVKPLRRSQRIKNDKN